MPGNRLKAIPATILLASAFPSGAYVVIDSAGLDEACSILRIVNNSNKDLIISYDGVTDHDFVPTLSTLQLPAQANALPTSNVAEFPKGMKVWVFADAAGTGAVYLCGYYQD